MAAGTIVSSFIITYRIVIRIYVFLYEDTEIGIKNIFEGKLSQNLTYLKGFGIVSFGKISKLLSDFIGHDYKSRSNKLLKINV